MTQSGGTNNTGTVFQMTPAGILTILHTFSATSANINADGANPQTALVESPTVPGTFYGTTNIGGTYGFGTFFRTTSAGVHTVLHSFRDTVTDGSNPTSLTPGRDGNLYGTTNGGGNNSNGTIFRYTAAGVFSTIFANFSLTSFYNNPTTVILGADGNFYGTTSRGNNGNGSIFEVTSGGVYSLLHEFAGSADGQYPPAGGGFLQDGQGNFYGVTTNSGPGNNGTVYKLSAGGTFSTLYSFTGTPSDAANPTTLLLGSDGNFYGTTNGGGIHGSAGQAYGTVFELTPTGDESVLYSFNALSSVTPANPTGLIQASDGTFYGTTTAYGDTVFRLDPNGAVGTLGFSAASVNVNENAGSVDVTVVRAGGSVGAVGVSYSTGNGSATAGTDYTGVSGTLTWADGDASPRTFAVPVLDRGVYDATTRIFSVLLATPTGGASLGSSNLAVNVAESNAGPVPETFQYTLGHYFTGQSGDGGSSVDAGAVVGRDGNLYGTTYDGGTNNAGTVYQFTPGGALSVLHNFGALGSQNINTDGAYPRTKLVESAASPGTFYGTTNIGGAYGYGALFQITGAGAFNLLHSFNNTASDGATPTALI